jgi:16S rRNA (uracil1498-N3)-methyltransferase
MHRLFAETSLLKSDNVVLAGDSARHLKVIRPKKGEKIELFDGKGSWRVYEWDGDALKAVSDVAVISKEKRKIILFACITKGSRWDWTIEKATELGVNAIVPVISERTIVRIPKNERASKRERFWRIAQDATRQSDAKFIPEISDIIDFDEAVERASCCRCFTGALTEEKPKHLLTALLEMESFDNEDIGVFIGPEGDFTSQELSKLMAVTTPVSLGPNILRAETAAVFALGIVSAFRSAR